MKSICVFCGSSLGNDTEFELQAYQLGKKLAQQATKLVYGGGKIGLMGVVARGCAENGGEVVGVIPRFLDKKEITNTDADELHVTASMHERKYKMTQLADGFIALPGGFGTMDELCEVLTWSQLGLIQKPIGLLNVNGYFDHLISLFKHMTESELVKNPDLDILIVENDMNALLQKMNNFRPSKENFMDKLGLT